MSGCPATGYGEAMLSIALALDKSLFGLAGRLGEAAWCREFWSCVSHSADLGLIWVLIAVLLTSRRRTRDSVLLLVGVAAAMIASEFLCDALKLLVARPRPYAQAAVQYSSLTPWAAYSFPSAHAARSFAAATFLSGWGSRWKAAALFTLAAVIGVSRVVVGAHWPSDVLGGALLGLGSGAAASFALMRIQRRSMPETRDADASMRARE